MQLLRARLEVVSGTPTTNAAEGRIAYDGTVGQQRGLICVSGAGAGTWVRIPRTDLQEAVTATWAFNAATPFTVNSTTQITNLNASLLQSKVPDVSLTVNTIVVRDAAGSIHVQDATDPTHAVNLRQLAAAASGRRDKDMVRVATTAALPSFVVAGNVLTASVNGALPAQDGVTLAAGNSILVKDEVGTNKRYNGFYTITSLGGASAKWSMTRRADADESSEMFIGATALVDEGALNQKTKWTLIDSTDDPVILGTSQLTFGKTDGNTLYKDGNGITLVGDTFHLGDGNPYVVGDLFVASDAANVNRLPAVAVGNVLISGGVASAPTWGKVTPSHFSGVLPVANGGTNSSAALSNGRVMVSSAGQIIERAALSAGVITVGDAATGIAPLGGGAANRLVGMNASGTAHEHKSITVTSAGVVTAGTWNGTAVGPAYGGTGMTSYAMGDLLIASAANTLGTLGAVAVGSVLISAGVGAVPAWGKVTPAHISGVWPIANGGTGQSNWVAGDILYASAVDTPARLPIGATDTAMIVNGGLPEWGKISPAHVTGVWPAANGGTGQGTYVIGDILYASTTTALSRLASPATGFAIISGGVGTAPSWGKISLTGHISGVLAVNNGGTGQSTVATGDILYASAAGTMSRRAIGANGSVLRVVSGVPNWAVLTAADVGGVGGSGSVNRLTKFTTGTTIANASLTDDGSVITALVPLVASATVAVTGGASGHLAFTASVLTESAVPVGGFGFEGSVLKFKPNSAFAGGLAGYNLKRVCMLVDMVLSSANATAGLHTALGLTMTITHNLGNAAPLFSIKDTTAQDDEVMVNWRPADANSIEIFFDVVPASGQYRVTIAG
ncbi:MAG: hypothetical protein IT581_14040 [Verrucomicrobiales bacterium]|nr:hypothetical protein [Verrucomicrobiales bacterium]